VLEEKAKAASEREYAQYERAQRRLGELVIVILEHEFD